MKIIAEVHHRKSEPWKVTLVDTGEDSMTGGRLGRVGAYLGNEPFCFTYGDGVDVDIRACIDVHRRTGKLATLTAVQPPGRYGALNLEESFVREFKEKPDGDNAWINGGFFVLEPSVLNWIEGDGTSWEADVLPRLASAGELTAYKHQGFWQPMDTLRDKVRLETLGSLVRHPGKCGDAEKGFLGR